MPLTDDYSHLTQMPDGKFCGLAPMLYTVGLFVGLDDVGYSHRYCYHNVSEAAGALMDWKAINFKGEPIGFIKRKD